MLQFDGKIIEEKWQGAKVHPSEKWNYCKSIPLQKLLSENYSVPPRNIAKKIVMGKVKNKKISQFQVGYMSFPVLDQNKAFKDKVEKYELGIWQKEWFPSK